jgi:hypothetical protein
VNLAPLRSAAGMMECWNIGMLGLEYWGNGGLGDFQTTILHFPTRNNGIIAFHALVIKEKAAVKPAVPIVSAVGVYLPEGRHPIIPFFHYSIIPINCERSEPKFYQKSGGLVKRSGYFFRRVSTRNSSISVLEPSLVICLTVLLIYP